MAARKLVFLFAVMAMAAGAGAKGIVGSKAPEIKIRQWVTANPPELDKLAGKVYLVEFWATWCHGCVSSIPHLIELNNKYRDRGLVFISVSADTSAKPVSKMIEKKQINYHVALDGGASDDFAVTEFPTIVIVNKDGRAVWHGYPWSEDLEGVIEKNLKASGETKVAKAGK